MKSMSVEDERDAIKRVTLYSHSMAETKADALLREHLLRATVMGFNDLAAPFSSAERSKAAT